MKTSASKTAAHAAMPSRTTAGESDRCRRELLTAIRDYRDSFDCELEPQRPDDREHDVENNKDCEPSCFRDCIEATAEEKVGTQLDSRNEDRHHRGESKNRQHQLAAASASRERCEERSGTHEADVYEQSDEHQSSEG